MLQNIQDYVQMAPNGLSILSSTVSRRFPLSDEWVSHDDPRAFATISTVAEIIQEILQRHASGIHFREYNAGPNLDGQMSEKGFDIDIQVDWKTGLIHGGNEHNCGTWMDKMVSPLSFFFRPSVGTDEDWDGRVRVRRRVIRVCRVRRGMERRWRLRVCSSLP
jgi:hypothetical protein